MAAEPIVRVAGASPALQHYQNPYTNGGTTYEVYRYVTWYDSPQDGTGAGDAADGNHNSVSDANGHDAKRVTVVVVWTNNVTGQKLDAQRVLAVLRRADQLQGSDAQRCADGVLPDSRSIAEMVATFSANGVRLRRDDRQRVVELRRRADRDGSAIPHAHVRGSGTYTVITTVVDNGGVRPPTRGGMHGDRTNPTSGTGGPDGGVSINGGATS